jgi:integrase
MSSLTIVTRQAQDGPRYLVRFRLGGRSYPIVHAGSFKTMKEAKARRDVVAGELAAGRNPAEALRALSAAPTATVSVNTWADRFLASRIDLAENTRKMYRSHLRKIGETFGDRNPATITAADVAEWVAERADERKAGTVAQYLDVFKVLLDYIGLEPNPARDPKVRLPRRVTEEANPPSDAHFLAIVEKLLPRWRLLFITIEQGGLRIGEAIALRWGDVDAAGNRLRLPRSATKTKTSRWVQLPEWLMEAIEDACPLEDRVPERKVFQGLEVSAARQAMTRACRLAKIPHYSPHDLRHRRLTIWHQSGVPARELAERAGHSKPSMSLDVYTHVMPVDEVPTERFLSLLTAEGR